MIITKTPFIHETDITVSVLQNPSGTIFFDIETTGLSPKTSMVYLIGCACLDGTTPVVIQWFAENKNEEPLIMKAFFEFAAGCSLLVHYNGSGFDIPYLQQRCLVHGLEFDFSSLPGIDLYKKISPYKKLLKLDSLRQKAVEGFLDIERDDRFSGGELISVYLEYLKNGDSECIEPLLLHNREDLSGLFKIMPMISYCSLFEGAFSITSWESESYTAFDGAQTAELVISLTLEKSIPRKIAGHFGCFYFSGSEDRGKLKIGLYDGELKYFYPDYGNYYYLPAEDAAIHKSVAMFVDREYRKKARAANCYTRKSGIFLPQFCEIITPSYKSEFKDKLTYFELTDDFLNDSGKLKSYVCHVLSLLV